MEAAARPILMSIVFPLWVAAGLIVLVVHELTVYWDLHYTTPLRLVGPFEQMVHSFLEILPLLSLALLAGPPSSTREALNFRELDAASRRPVPLVLRIRLRRSTTH